MLVVLQHTHKEKVLCILLGNNLQFASLALLCQKNEIIVSVLFKVSYP